MSSLGTRKVASLGSDDRTNRLNPSPARPSSSPRPCERTNKLSLAASGCVASDANDQAEPPTRSALHPRPDHPGLPRKRPELLGFRFCKVQVATDDYQLGTGYNSSVNTSTGWTSATDSLALTDTVSASWEDDGVDQLTSTDSLTGVTDDYTWDEYESMTVGNSGSTINASTLSAASSTWAFAEDDRTGTARRRCK